MSLKHSIAAIAIAMLIASAPAMAKKKQKPVDTIVDIVVNSEDHTILETVVIDLGLVGLLDGKKKFTVFAPTDEAFLELDAALAGLGGLGALSTCQLANVVYYHVLNGNRSSKSVVNKNNPKWLKTLNGEFITSTPDLMLIDTSPANDALPMATITAPNIKAKNGYVHVIDQVLVPETVLDDC